MTDDLCPRCGAPLPSGSGVCLRCGALRRVLPSAPPPVPPAGSPIPWRGDYQPIYAPPERSRAGRNVTIVLGVLVAIVVVFAVLPLPHPFSYQLFSTTTTAPTASFDLPTGSPVSGQFSTAGGGRVTFSIADRLGQTVYSDDASDGDFSFTASDPPYTMGAYSPVPETLTVWGQWTAPYL